MQHKLAEIILDRAEELTVAKDEQELLLETLNQAETLHSDDATLLCRSAKILFRYGILHNKGSFFLLALDKLRLADEKNPDFFQTESDWLQLWGNILVQLGKLLNDSSFFEGALEKYRQAAFQTGPGLYWDWADAWALLGQKSGEHTDIQQALAKYQNAQHEGMHLPFFRLDYGKTLVYYGQFMGNPYIVEEGLQLYRGVIADTYYPDEEPTILHNVAWRQLALGAKVLFQISHRQDDFEEAGKVFRDAILVSPKNSDLWLDWGELYLEAGWLRRDLKLLEEGLEKLTSSKIKECDPLRVSYLLSRGLVMLGLFVESLKLIKEGEERVRRALEAAPQDRSLIFARGLAELGLGLYFSDGDAFARAASIFERGIRQEATAIENWYALFQTYLAWGLDESSETLLQKGITAIARVCALLPFSPIHLNEWGVALLRLREFKKHEEAAQACIEEAIDKFKKAWELLEENETLYNWGCALDQLGDIIGDEGIYGEAIDLLSRALEKSPSQLHIRYHLGLAFSHLGELTGDKECLSQAIEQLELVAKATEDDENVWCDLGYALLNLSQVHFDSFCPEEGESQKYEAEKVFLHAIELGSGDACYHLACLYSLAGLIPASIHYLKKAEAADCLPHAEDLVHDEWLQEVRKTEVFKEFLSGHDQDE